MEQKESQVLVHMINRLASRILGLLEGRSENRAEMICIREISSLLVQELTTFDLIARHQVRDTGNLTL